MKCSEYLDKEGFVTSISRQMGQQHVLSEYLEGVRFMGTFVCVWGHASWLCVVRVRARLCVAAYSVC